MGVIKLGQTKLEIQISSIDSSVINGDMLADGERIGTVQFHSDAPTRKAFKQLRRVGIEIKIPRHLESK